MSKIKKIFSAFYQKALDKHESKIVSDILDMNSDPFECITQPCLKKIEKIAFVVGTIQTFSGGHTSMLRIGTLFAKKGIDVHYVCFKSNDNSKMEFNARKNLSSVQGKFINYNDALSMDFDVCVATSWESVYWSKALNGYKAYFVQDYEPYFFKLNERYLLAKYTYELGYHIISLGRWNIEQIKNSCNINGKIDYVDFPYEPSEYKEFKRDYNNYSSKRTVKLAIYSKEDGKRIPNLMQGILKRSKKALSQKGIELDITFFGFNKNYKVTVGNNVGKLNKQQMTELYNASDFGMVASMTNISLVPYEMLATGLPVIEFKNGSYTSFLPEDSAILIDFNPKTFANSILSYLNEPKKIINMVDRGKEALASLSWKQTADEFLAILEKSINSEE